MFLLLLAMATIKLTVTSKSRRILILEYICMALNSVPFSFGLQTRSYDA